jgi:hypothetical protein
MNFQQVKRNLLILFSLSIIIFSACTKIITTDIGSGLLPPADNVATKDTFITLTAKNAGDSVISPAFADDHVVGVVNDPLFGQTTAKINLQLAPSYFPYTFPVSNINDSIIGLDSVVLVLHFDGVWGDSALPVPLHVYQLASDQPFTVDSVYNTGENFSNQGEVTYNNTPVYVNSRGLSTDSFHAYQDSGVSAIRIRLNNNIGTNFLGFTADQYQNDSIFNNNFRGFQIASDASADALLKINLSSADTKLAIYFKYRDPDTSGKIDTAVRYFNTTSGVTAHANTITRNIAGSEFARTFPASLASTAGDSLLYVEANPGNYVNIMIPKLTGFKNVLVHRAELLMTSIPDVSDQFLTPPNLLLAGYFSDSARRIALYTDMVDVNNNVSLATFGSFPVTQYNPSLQLNTASYNFNISRYVQGIITRNDTNYTKLVLYAPFYNEYLYSSQTATTTFEYISSALNSPACGRVRLRGGSTDATDKTRMVLHLVYSDL